ncbi:MAG: HAD family phosphatase, partial [Chloroflexi bacterium]|nr:HAD family phosphatase [Chloroflexota bacterium]
LPGSVALIRRAFETGWIVAVASRALRRRLLRTLDLVQMPPLFDVVLGSEDVVDPGTDRKVHARVAHIFGIDPAACVVIEDSVSGVRDAVACGTGTVIGLTTSLDGAALRAAGAHEVVDHLDAVNLEVV